MKTIRPTLTAEQLQKTAGLVDIAIRTIGSSIAQAGLEGLDQGIAKLNDAREIRDLLQESMQPKPKKTKE